MNLLEKYICRAEKTVSRIIDGEAVIVLLKEREKKIITLTPTGSKLWKLIENRSKVKDVIRQVTNELDVDYNEYMDEILTYIERLIKNELIDLC